MPRSCSTLLQNILNQHPDFYATPTDGCLDLLQAARDRFTNAPEFRAAIDQDHMLKVWRSFCKGGMEAYARALSDKPNIVLKSRGYINNVQWLTNFLGERPKIICMVRNLKGILASMEKLHRNNPDKTSQWFIGGELRGTTVEKRVDMYVQNIPVGATLDMLRDTITQNQHEHILFVRAEDLTTKPQVIMAELYQQLGVEYYEHDFDNVAQTTHENDVIHGLDNNLHTIKNKVEPLKEDYENVFTPAINNWIDQSYEWYQSFFGYTVNKQVTQHNPIQQNLLSNVQRVDSLNVIN